MKRPEFANEEFYHVFNHGVEGRNIFDDTFDIERFRECLSVFNTVDPVKSLYLVKFHENSQNKSLYHPKNTKKLVNIICYCLNTNHYHILLEQVSDGGVSEFMKRINGGYTWYFNHKHERRGRLFEGVYQAKHVVTNEYLLQVSAYVNLNFRVHKLQENKALYRSSWDEYRAPEKSKIKLCDTSVILEQFKNRDEYCAYAEEAVLQTISLRETDDALAELTIE